MAKYNILSLEGQTKGYLGNIYDRPTRVVPPGNGNGYATQMVMIKVSG